MQFPPVRGANLDRQEKQYPRDFDGEYNILLIAFYQHHQQTVNTWLPFVRQAETQDPRIRYYEFPVIRSMNRLRRFFINEGMRAGIPDPLARQRTITLYLDKAAFRQALEIRDEEEIAIVLADRQGAVLWQGRGAFSPEKGQAMLGVIHKPTSTP